ncbi:MAG TPA: helix-turn-helix domain-containing protein [Baekduia sp.]|uniref:helix-turn-helix domain-containing protein n=1 Tax=Baekduia sp. TaxID=2600305 RepID=UPI002D76C6BF|nr:helix-turn-helix domain-containing protein [Baekduia sp.]HET6506198.1 helix-turn-helix domain-containing protein [Baekduia sp.]
MDGIARGPHPLSLADWPFGSAARRGLLAAVLLRPAPATGWSTRELERLAGVTRGGLRHALDGAQAWGLIARDADGRWHRPARESDLAAPLRELLVAIDSSHPETMTAAAPPPPPGKRSRRRATILRHLDAAGPAHVTELSSLTGASRATVYRELRALRDARAITVRRGVATRRRGAL